MPPPVPPARRTARSGNKGRRLDSAQARAAPLAGLAVFKVSLRYSQIGAWQAEFRTKEAAIRSHAAAHGETVTQHCSAESPAAYLAALLSLYSDGAFFARKPAGGVYFGFSRAFQDP